MTQLSTDNLAASPNILGISAKSIRPPRTTRKVKDLARAIDAKCSRFTLQRTAQSLLYDAGLSASRQKRVCWCCRTVKTRGETLGVYRVKSGESARLSGLNTCGSVWHCPVCAAKITEERRKELDRALTAWVKIGGGKVQLLTLTFPHQLYELDPATGENRPVGLADQMVKFAKALQTFKNSKVYQRILGDAGRAGSIRSLEATWGANGWHPHTHDLVFLKDDLTDSQVYELSTKWINALLNWGLAGLSDVSNMRMLPGKGRGCIALTLQDGKYAADYIAKFGHDSAWGAASEITKPHSKIGKIGEFGGEDHFTPFQILAWAENGDDKAAALFREFAEVFEGKRMLSWSRGLRDKLQKLDSALVAELSNEEIAARDEPMPEETRIGNITTDQYAILLARNGVGQFIHYVATCCFDPETGQADIDEYIGHIAKTKKTHSSNYLKRHFIGYGWLVLH